MSKSNNTTKTVTIAGFYHPIGASMYELADSPPESRAIQKWGDHALAAFGDHMALIDIRSHRALNAGIWVGDKVNIRRHDAVWFVDSKA